jgi:ribosome-associated protein
MGKISSVEPTTITIESEYITLGQFLKFAGIISMGSEAKSYLSQNEAVVNGEKEARRGRKLRPGDLVVLPKEIYQIAKR